MVMEGIGDTTTFRKLGDTCLNDPNNEKISIKYVGTEGNRGLLYDEIHNRPICAHVSETEVMVAWLMYYRRDYQSYCPVCAEESSEFKAKSDLSDPYWKERLESTKRYKKPRPRIELAQIFSIKKDSIPTAEGSFLDKVPTEAVIRGGRKDPAGEEETFMYVTIQNGVAYKMRLSGDLKETPSEVRVENLPGVVLNKMSDIKGIPLKNPDIPFADERGLLGMAFHPEYDTPTSIYYRRMYVSYSLPSKDEKYDHVSRLSCLLMNIEENGVVVEKVLIDIEQPEMNHNGGHIEFGPPSEDTKSGIGYLYYGAGDGGGRNDEHGDLLDPIDEDSYLGNAQDLTNLRGKILRIDVNVYEIHAEGHLGSYFIPESNPARVVALATGGGEISWMLPEIFAYGLRNPWKFSFVRDAKTGTASSKMFVADVGQNRIEEVNLIHDVSEVRSLPRNFGWRAMEGSEVFNEKVMRWATTKGLKFEDPIVEYPHLDKPPNAIVGGYYYEGDLVPALKGTYLFADYNGRMFYAHPSKKSKTGWTMHELDYSESGESETTRGGRITTFARGPGGELFVLRNLEDYWTVSLIRAEDMTEYEIETLVGTTVQAANLIDSDLRRDPINNEIKATKMHVTVVSKSGVARTVSMGGAWQNSWDIARSKAHTVLGFSSDENAMTSRSVGELSQTGPWSGMDPKQRPPLHQVGTSNPTTGIIEFAGGIPIYRDSRLVGGLGVSGDTPDKDEQVAVKGLMSFNDISSRRYETPRNIRIDVVTEGRINFYSETLERL